MYLEKVAPLATYLTKPNRTLQEICRFLVLETFSEFDPRAIYVAKLVDENQISHTANFGYELSDITRRGALPLTVHIPITDAIRSSSSLILNGQEESLEKYPLLRQFSDFKGEWQSFISCPIDSFGGYSLILHKAAPENHSFESFLSTVGHLISMHQVNNY